MLPTAAACDASPPSTPTRRSKNWSGRLERAVRRPMRPARHPAASVVRGGRSEFSPEMSDAFLRTTTRNDEHYRIVRELDFTSYLCVPLAARGRILGALTTRVVGIGPSLHAGRSGVGRGVRRAAPRSCSTTRASTPSATTSRVRSKPACCHRRSRRSRVFRSRPDTGPPARATRSAATSTTCSRCDETTGVSSSVT